MKSLSLKEENSSAKAFNRREFLIGSSALLAGLALNANSFGAEADEPVFDIHQHTNYMDRTNDQLVAHQRKLGISKTILLPSGTPANYGSTHYGYSNGLLAKATGNEVCYQLAKQYPGEFLFGANEVPDLPNATAEIEKYLKLGACVIGESKFNVECDAPEMQKIYQLAGEYNVPVLMHWQYKMFNGGFERFHKMLAKYPKVKFIGHSQTWWGNIDRNLTNQNILYPKGKITPGGITERLLSDYDNIYGDFSAGSGLKFLQRDEEYSISFLKKFQDKLLFGSDCYDSEASGPACHGGNLITTIKKLSPTADIRKKILYGNAVKLFGK